MTARRSTPCARLSTPCRRDRPGLLTPQEERIIALWDGGMGMEGIIRATRLPRGSVRRCVQLYGQDERGADARAMARGSALLLRALIAARHSAAPPTMPGG